MSGLFSTFPAFPSPTLCGCWASRGWEADQELSWIILWPLAKTKNPVPY